MENITVIGFIAKHLLMRSGGNKVTASGATPKFRFGNGSCRCVPISSVIGSITNRLSVEEQERMPTGCAGHETSHNSGPFNDL